MKKPTLCFVTLDNEEACDAVDHYNQGIESKEFDQYIDFLGDELRLKESCEPSDVIWENKPNPQKFTS